jgi:acetyl-CoA/propionyl-CoA carboxylase biotin carboxyl carrier protein
VEFIVASAAPAEFFFMEMNTRLQVEHPVTELVTGLDLVEQQLRVAAGERLGFTQGEVRLTGHAVEARLYAEDPARGFLPTGGRALLVREPAGDGIRVDSSLAEGTEISSAYDPMLSKVIAWGADRASALARLDQALAANVLLGVQTNGSFLRALVADPDVRAGRMDTGLIERHLDDLIGRSHLRPPEPGDLLVAYALGRLLEMRPASDDPWDVLDGWRLAGSAEISWTVSTSAGGTRVLRVTGTPQGARVGVDGEPSVAAAASPADGGFTLTAAGTTRQVSMVADGSARWLWLDGAAHVVTERPAEALAYGAASADADIRSPMPGTVIAVSASPGEAVRLGQVIMIVEAMKMEHSLRAPFDGIVVDLLARAGQQVKLDEVLARLDPDPDPHPGSPG